MGGSGGGVASMKVQRRPRASVGVKPPGAAVAPAAAFGRWLDLGLREHGRGPQPGKGPQGSFWFVTPEVSKGIDHHWTYIFFFPEKTLSQMDSYTCPRWFRCSDESYQGQGRAPGLRQGECSGGPLGLETRAYASGSTDVHGCGGFL